MAYTQPYIVRMVAIGYMTDTMGRMHSDALSAGSSSVKPYGLFLLRTSAIKTSFIALGLSSVPAHVEMMGFLGIGTMVDCTIACKLDSGGNHFIRFVSHYSNICDAWFCVSTLSIIFTRIPSSLKMNVFLIGPIVVFPSILFSPHAPKA